MTSQTLLNRIHQAAHTRVPLVMGVVNVTPDSFSDGGQHARPDEAIAHGLMLVDQGADILDVGGESTRPGAMAVSVDEELARVIPVIESLKAKTTVPISIDTSKPEVMAAALRAGVDLVNDVRALQAPGALSLLAEADVPVILMHMQGLPETMQANPQYGDVVDEVQRFFEQRMMACVAAGLDDERIILDPGIGFGKRLVHNIGLLQRMDGLLGLKRPLMIGLSRKSMLAEITGKQEPSERVAASVAGAVWAANQGAAIIRVHDVDETVDALKVWQALALDNVVSTD